MRMSPRSMAQPVAALTMACSLSISSRAPSRRLRSHGQVSAAHELEFLRKQRGRVKLSVVDTAIDLFAISLVLAAVCRDCH